MFGKRPIGGKDALNQRVRALSARGASPDLAKSATPPASKQPKLRPSRDAVFKNGSLTLPDGARIAVVIKDLSAAGARVEFFARTTLPQMMVLSEPMLKLKVRVRVVWQDGGAAGLEILDANT